jgi:hypothetical protein
MVSALWHGFYPNYYICFFFAFELEQICAILMKKTFILEDLEKYKKTKYLLLYIIGGIISLLGLNVAGIYFSLTTFEIGNAFVLNVKFVPYIIIILVHVLLVAMPNFRKRKEGKEKKEEEIKKE